MTRFIGLAVFTLAVALAPSVAHAEFLTYVATLSGPNESPANTSPGIGAVTINIDTLAHSMRVQLSFSGLLGNTAAAHIHSATATPGSGTSGVATMLPALGNFPLGVTSGSLDQTFNTLADSFYNPAYVAANGGTAASAEMALFAGIEAGEAYFNIHTSVYPAGEIRGFLTQSVVPEPSSLLLLSLGGLGLAGLAHRRRRSR